MCSCCRHDDRLRLPYVGCSALELGNSANLKGESRRATSACLHSAAWDFLLAQLRSNAVSFFQLKLSFSPSLYQHQQAAAMGMKEVIFEHFRALDRISRNCQSASQQHKFAKIQIGGFSLDFGGHESHKAPVVEERIIVPAVELEDDRRAVIVHQKRIRKRTTKKKITALKAAGIGLWSAAAVSLFQHSFVRAAECLTGNTDSVLISDAVILGLVSASAECCAGFLTNVAEQSLECLYSERCPVKQMR